MPEELAEFAYDDAPLPIGDGQTISQPYIVAVTIEALELRGGERVLEIGTGSGYAAAVLSRIAKEVYTVERLESLAARGARRLARLGYDNVHVLCGDGSLGWPEHAPYDAIAVAAGGPEVPEALLAQLALGGRLVIPVGPDESSQMLVRVTRESDGALPQEALADVRFVPLIGEQGWPEADRVVRARASRPAEPTPSQARPRGRRADRRHRGRSIDALLERIGDARVVLLGEATHGTSEFYRMRARITRELIERRGFDFVAVEADWPDAARVDDYVSDERPGPASSSRRSRGSRPGCGATRRSTSSSTGCAPTTGAARPRAPRRASTGSTSTACSRRSPRARTTSTTSIPTPRGWRAHATAR